MKKNLTKQYKEKLQTLDGEKLHNEFHNACGNGMLNTIKYILTSNQVKSFDIDVENNDDKTNGLGYAAVCDKVEVIKYLLTSPDLEVKANIKNAIKYACLYGSLNSLKYLLEYNNNNENDIYFKKNEEYKGLNAANYSNNQEIIEYLILIYKMDYSKQVEKICLENKRLQNMFDRRKLNEVLNKDLNEHNLTLTKKNKI